MAEAQDIERVVEEIADRVRHSMLGSRVGSEPPASPVSTEPPRPVKTARIDPESIRDNADLAPYIDHTLLKPEATREDIVRVAREAVEHGFSTVCVNSSHVATVAGILAGSKSVPIAVVGFPLGAALTSAKAFEARMALHAGAREIDMVLNIGALKEKDYALVLEDIARVVEASRPHPVKVILETSLLSQDEKIAACVLSKAAGAAFVKTSTGFSTGGATVEDVALMRRLVGEDVGVKASGGIRSAEDALKMIRAGANRLGASASVAIVTGQRSTAKY
ncbi:deoxyribose-phosphate aldolase [Vitiosangium sp. GDMCC 1.1324]|uniref:deoxyribose-phosphate aldolase n=1 Tax=Vitiosangium sp. (strain GDMCC 1.1324) TaxID=2138576 RepID=UPI000D335BEF|nr:deoxyribose-phosphate aldolase [Vitiosangium sp. GDMCC 1.1324]PTL78484.1 deoxyribose-phosphate aldolase [Vitiosangium sp. GDMCC 1.1324]